MYGGSFFVVEYDLDGITHHWNVSGSGTECKIEKKDNIINYITYDLEVLEELAKYAY